MKNLLEDKEIEDIKKIDLYFSLGKAYEDGSFEVLGRMDNSDLRGCNLMIG